MQIIDIEVIEFLIVIIVSLRGHCILDADAYYSY